MASADLLAHSQSRGGRDDTVADHLQAVARRAAEFASAFGAEEEARLAGLLHDLGKYGDLFQRRLRRTLSCVVDHSSAGAWCAYSKYGVKGVAAALAIQGHHLGLQESDRDELERLNPMELAEHSRRDVRVSEKDLNVLLARLEEDRLLLPGAADVQSSVYDPTSTTRAASMLDVRMLFSALVDADFVETEKHFHPERSLARQNVPLLQPETAFGFLRQRLDELADRSKKGASEDVRKMRLELLDACLTAANLHQGLFTLTAPTGSGKTLSMLAFALKHAEKRNLRRIVYVVPYLSIIEQTVKEYRKVFVGHFPDDYLLEQHSLAGTHGEDDGKEGDVDSQRLRSENWDAPVVVTTSVQFLESLFSNRPSACRKLHRLAKSVILFDEVQTLPTGLAIPTLATLSRLVEPYQATVVFATATQPAFSHLHDKVKEYCACGWQPEPIVPAALRLFDRARRTEVRWPDLGTKTPWGTLAEQLKDHAQVLCVVNLKRHALTLFEKLEELCGSDADLFHLSTNMCPAHRRVVLYCVRRRLRDGKPCCLVSTQCIEAGVDVDFPVAFRAWGPLDSIAQAAGRCNRNGKADSGTVHVFLPEDEKYPDVAYRQAAAVAEDMLKRSGSADLDIHDPALFQAYYRKLYYVKGVGEDEDDELMKAIKMRHFRKVAENYHVIEKRDAVNVLVPFDDDEFNALRDKAEADGGIKRDWIVRARPHAVSLFRPRPEDLRWGWLAPVCSGGSGLRQEEWYELSWNRDTEKKEDCYDPKLGLVLQASERHWIA
jgi:CRISPR-associated helicase Cas3/CRISPR-associated endonuclease Cas3-HD